jgi:hypothetical protein
MKHTILIMTIALSFLFSGYSFAANNVSIDLRFVNLNVNVGDEFPVDVIIDQVTNLKGVNIIISFDNLKLEYVSTSKGPVISKFSEDITPDSESAKTTGKIEYMAVLEDPGPGIESSGGILMTVNFLVRAPGNTWVKLLPNETALADSTANAIPTSIDESSRSVNVNQIFELKRVFNYPNPVTSGNTTIRCEALAILDNIEAKIFDISGELVKEIVYSDFNSSKAPVYEYIWDGKNEKSQDVANGTYILWIKAKLDSDEKNQTWKIAVLR